MRVLGMETLLLVCLACMIRTAQAAGNGNVFPGVHKYNFTCPHAIFAFGDSLSDTGELIRLDHGVPSASLPYGITFPGYPTGRFSDGKLVIDFIAEEFGLPLLDPYFKVRSSASGGTRGVNYAAGGATARNTAIKVPLYLQAQVDQAILFQSRLQTDRSLFHIQIGGNDFMYALQVGTPVETLATVIGPQTASNISLAITRLYDSVGARLFLVWNLPFLGCAEDVRCLEAMHAILGELNSQREATIRQLRLQLPDALIIVADIHSIISTVAANPQKYGFTEPFRACCGPVECGPESSVCKNPSQHVVWDGVHTTQALNKVVADAIVTGEILDPPINFRQLCLAPPLLLKSW